MNVAGPAPTGQSVSNAYGIGSRSKCREGDVPAMSGLPPVSGRSCVIAVGLRSANNGREQMQQRVVLFNYFVGAGEQRGAEGRERRDQLFSSRLSSLKKRQSVPCEMILLGVDLIMPDSCNRSA